MYKLDIQLFAEDDKKEMSKEQEKELLERLGVKEETLTEEQVETEEQTEKQVEEEVEEQVEKQVEEQVEEEQKGGIAELRRKQKEDAQKVKELEELKKLQEEEFKTKTEKLMKAVRLGIKGDTEEEVLANLKDYEVKEEAKTKGLTEEQILAQEELEEKMNSLTQREQEYFFNKRAFDLQRDLNLSNEQIKDFINRASSTGINLLTSGVDFKTIYNNLYGNTINDPQIQALQKQIDQLMKENEKLKNDRAPGSTPPGGTTEEDPEDWLTQIRNMKVKN